MEYLLTGGVAAFQLAIMASIVAAARIGRGTLSLVTTGWVLFTLFGSIFTAGLLLLQLITISIAYGIGRSIRSTDRAKSTEPHAHKTPAEASWLSTIGIGAAVAIAYSVFVHERPPPQTQPMAGIMTLSEKPEAAPIPRQVIERKRASAKGQHQDSRECLKLPTNNEIAKCANNGK